MTSNWSISDFIVGIFGGFLICVGTSLLLWAYGRLTNPSSIFNSLITIDRRGSVNWKFCFFAGMISCPSILGWIYGSSFYIGNNYVVFFDTNATTIYNAGAIGWSLGGFLVGLGVRMATGDQTYHGICAVPYLSRRSIMAVLMFTGTGIVVATLKSHNGFLTNGVGVNDSLYDLWNLIMHILFVLILIYYIFILVQNFSSSLFKEYVITYIAGATFGSGFLFAGMCRVSRVSGMLTLSSYWDPTLVVALGSAITMNFFSFQIILRKLMPKYSLSFSAPQSSGIDKELIIGSIMFGAGWGITGVDPGSVLIELFVYTHSMFYVVFMALGMIIYDRGLLSKFFHKYDMLD